MKLKDKRQDTNKGTDFVRYAYSEEDVKEFINKIQKILNKTESTAYALHEIEKLAGEDLI